MVSTCRLPSVVALHRLVALSLVVFVAIGAEVLAPIRGGDAGASTATQYYVSLGDSYAIGFQPSLGATHFGYADQVVTKARPLGYRFQLVNFGCGGATTKSILLAAFCRAPAIGGASYGGLAQAPAAEKFLRQHRGQVRLVTVSVGGNDVTMCAKAKEPIGCVTSATAGIKTGVGQLASDLRSAAGSNVPIIGLTYPDVVLGQWVRPPVNQNLAQLSVTAFKALINPALNQAYTAGAGTFVDVTDATDAYVPLTQTVNLPPYGVIPDAVATVCKLTYYCGRGDIHANTAGYGVIAKLIVAALPHA